MLINKYEFWKIVRTVLKRFILNTKSRERLTRPLNMEEINKLIEILIERKKSIFEATEQFQNDVKQ